MELVVSFKKDDEELITILQQQFGNKVKYEEGKGFDGLEILLTAVIPITALTIEIVDFILNNFWNKNKITDNNDKKRIIIDSDGNIDLSNYEEEEARKIIECYFRNQNDKEK